MDSGDGQIGKSRYTRAAAPYHAAGEPPAADLLLRRRDGDYAAYVELMAEWCREEGVAIWACCLMPNHVHLIAVPAAEPGLRRAIGEAHRRYTRRINFREKWRGDLWQGRFASLVMDESYLLAALRYVELNPVRANLVGDGQRLARVAGEPDA